MPVSKNFVISFQKLHKNLATKLECSLNNMNIPLNALIETNGMYQFNWEHNVLLHTIPQKKNSTCTQKLKDSQISLDDEWQTSSQTWVQIKERNISHLQALAYFWIKGIPVFPQKIFNCLPRFWCNLASIECLDFILDATFGKKAVVIHTNNNRLTSHFFFTH